MKELPHLSSRVYARTIRPDQPFRRNPSAPGPLMAFSLDRVKHPARFIRAALVLQARDIRRNYGFNRIRCALVAPGPLRKKL